MKALQTEFPPGFYVVGGTMRHDALSYVERQADQVLLAALRRGEFCYVLTARQMGKSSLMIRTAARLREAGIGVAVLDLTAVGQNLTAEQWYGGLLVQIGQRLDLEDELIEFWLAQGRLGPMQRWVKALRAVVLPRYPGRLVIFIDEIDAVRSLPFSTDEFFAGIRECYNQCSEDLEMERVTFCLSGVATPSDLIRNTRTTPFNIGRRIELHDFTAAEAAPLADGLGRAGQQGAALLRRILRWTGGHPYLTQRLCQAVAADKSIAHDAEVDRLCAALFCSPRAQERDDNLLFVRECLLRSEADLSSLLELYAKVRAGQRVSDDETNPLVSTLRLAGITRPADGSLRVRNRIYAQVFGKKWVADNMPDAEVRRQRAAYRRGVWRTALVSVAVLALVGWLAFLAVAQRNRAEQQAAANRRLLDFTQFKLAPQERADVSTEKIEDLLTATIYHTQMKLALQEWDHANVERVEELLLASAPQPGMKDWRSFEWHWLWRLAHSEVGRLKAERQVASAIFLPDDKTVAMGEVRRAQSSGSDQYLIKLYDWQTSQPVSSFTVPAGRNFDLVVFSPDKRRVAVDDAERAVTLWDVHSGQQLAVFKGHSHAISVIAFALDGRQLATGDLAGTVKLWDVATGQERLALQGRQRWIRWAAFSPDGRLLATTDEAQAVRVWEAATGRELPPFVIDEGALVRAAFFPDGKRLVTTARDGRLHFWDVRTRRVIAPLSGHASEATSFAFAPDGKTLATGSIDRAVKLWDAATGRELGTIRGHGSAINSVAWSTAGQHLVTGSRDGAIKIWDVAAKQELRAPNEPVARYLATTFSPARELLAVGATRDLRVKLWNLATGRELAQFAEVGDNILCATFSPDQTLLATGGLGDLVKLWDVATGKLIRTLQGHTAHVYSVDFSPDGKLLVSGGEDRALKLWDVARGQELIAINQGGDNYYRAVFSWDSKKLASACRDGSVKLWDVATGTLINTFNGHTDRVRAIAFSRDDGQLATGGNDNTVRLWDVATGQELMKLGQSDFIQRAAFSHDGRRLVTGGVDGTVKMWDVTTRQELMILPSHAGAVSAVTFSADGMDLATSGADGTLRLWRAGIAKEGSAPH